MAPQKERKVMKRNLMVLSFAGLICATAAQTWAQSQVSGDDGITASPKVRQMLNERKAQIAASTAAPAAPAVSTTIPRNTEMAASPKVRQQMLERARVPVVTAESEVAGYRPTGADGITASPKLRQMLNEREQTVQIAPLK
jgi:hypothetical protein